MSKITTRPNETISINASWTIGGGAGSAHAALSDDSDATYIQTIDNADKPFRLGFAEPSIPAGAVVKQDVIRLRTAKDLGTALRLSSVIAYPDGSTASGSRTNFDTTWQNANTGAVITASTDLDHSDLELAVTGRMVETDVLGAGFIYAAYWDTIYVEQPTVDSVSVDPASPISDDDTPTFSWTQTADADGGFPSKHHVKVFTDAQYGAGGFDPDTSTATLDSDVIDSLATEWEATSNLADDTYRAYVRVANVVNGEELWSDWEYVQFTLAVDRPAEPTITATAEDGNGRIRLEPADPGGGAVSSDNFQIQRSRDGGTTWDYIRTVDDFSLIDAGDTAYDYETGNGEIVKYRARSLHTFPSGTTSKSDWVETSAVDWSSTSTWIKHPNRPDLNLTVRFYSQPGRQRAARKSRKDVLGREDPIVVYDTARSGSSGEITFMVDEDDLEDFEELIASQVPLLVQTPATQKWTDRWLALGDLDAQRYVDKAWVEEGLNAFAWDEVAAPSGDLVTWA